MDKMIEVEFCKTTLHIYPRVPNNRVLHYIFTDHRNMHRQLLEHMRTSPNQDLSLAIQCAE